MVNPYYLSAGPIMDPMPMGMIPLIDFDLRDYPEEIREALEQRRNEIGSAEDLKRIAFELMYRR